MNISLSTYSELSDLCDLSKLVLSRAFDVARLRLIAKEVAGNPTPYIAYAKDLHEHIGNKVTGLTRFIWSKDWKEFVLMLSDLIEKCESEFRSNGKLEFDTALDLLEAISIGYHGVSPLAKHKFRNRLVDILGSEEYFNKFILQT